MIFLSLFVAVVFTGYVQATAKTVFSLSLSDYRRDSGVNDLQVNASRRMILSEG